MFTRVDLDQGTSHWLAWRADGIGASEAAAIMGENPWKSRQRLLRDKIAARQNGGRSGGFANAAMARGTALEPLARAAYVRETGKHVEPACLVSTRHSWLRASLDGIDIAARHVTEIKCGEKVHAETAKNGVPPKYYLGQLQHILAVTGYDQIDFWCWLPERTPQLVTIVRDEAYIDRMLDAEARFWDDVLGG